MIKHSIKIQKELGLSFLSIFTRRSFSSKISNENGSASETNKTENSVPKADIKDEKDKKPVVLVEKNDNVTLIGINRPEVRNCVNIETAKHLSEGTIFFYSKDLYSQETKSIFKQLHNLKKMMHPLLRYFMVLVVHFVLAMIYQRYLLKLQKILFCVVKVPWVQQDYIQKSHLLLH